MGRGLPTNGALDGSSPRAHAVLLHNDGDALVAEAVAAGEHCPLEERERDDRTLQKKDVRGVCMRKIYTIIICLVLNVVIKCSKNQRGSNTIRKCYKKSLKQCAPLTFVRLYLTFID